MFVYSMLFSQIVSFLFDFQFLNLLLITNSLTSQLFSHNDVTPTGPDFVVMYDLDPADVSRHDPEVLHRGPGGGVGLPGTWGEQGTFAAEPRQVS